MCQIYSELTIKTPELHLVLLLLTLNIFALYSTVTNAEFEKINADWAWETLVSENKFVSSDCEKFIVGLGEFVGLYVFIFTHPTQGYQRINFHDSVLKR